MVPSPKHSFVANDDNLTNTGLAPGSTIHFGSLEFTVDGLGRLSLSPKEWDSSVIFDNLKMISFEVLYGCHFRTPLNWIELGEKVIFGPDHITKAEVTVHRIHDNLKATKSRQESYANKRHRPLEFEDGYHVYL
jgi:hypothetical protein